MGDDGQGRGPGRGTAVGTAGIAFLGDVACPTPLRPPFPDGLGFDLVVVNLEGALGRPSGAPWPKRYTLYNDPIAVDALTAWNVRVASLANNHILDITDSPRATVERLARSGIDACGAGDTLAEAACPAVLREDGRELVFIAFGWPPVQCPPASRRRPGVNPLRPAHVLASVRRARREHPAGRIVALMHWNYSLERYPQPLHRQLAFATVDAGADAVVGHHPHCVQGVEFHEGAPIVYSLGNWFVPQGRWFGRMLSYPDFASLQLAFEWLPDAGGARCHWYRYDRSDHSLTFERAEPVDASERIQELTPFRGLDHEAYTRWFEEHRRQRRALPVYRDYRNGVANWLKDRWVAARQRASDAAVALQLR